MNYKIKIIGLEYVEWRKLKWLQNENFKVSDDVRKEKLKNSLKKHLIRPFYVWKEKKNMWILDGHRREKEMRELENTNFKFPDKLPALIIDCKNNKEAAQFMLMYDSHYYDVEFVGMQEFMKLNKLLLNDIEDTSISGIDLEMFLKNDLINNNESLSQIETAKNLSDVYIVVGEYRILIERDIYLNWMEEIKQKNGFNKMAVMKEIKRRLKIK